MREERIAASGWWGDGLVACGQPPLNIYRTDERLSCHISIYIYGVFHAKSDGLKNLDF